jgi:hypothetical protein
MGNGGSHPLDYRGLHVAQDHYSLILPKARLDLKDMMGKAGTPTYAIDGQLAEHVFVGSNTMICPSSLSRADVNTITPVVLKWFERIVEMRKRACMADPNLQPNAMRFTTTNPCITQFMNACVKDLMSNCTVRDIANYENGNGGLMIPLPPGGRMEQAKWTNGRVGAPEATPHAPMQKWQGQHNVLPQHPPPGPGGSLTHH